MRREAKLCAEKKIIITLIINQVVLIYARQVHRDRLDQEGPREIWDVQGQKVMWATPDLREHLVRWERKVPEDKGARKEKREIKGIQDARVLWGHVALRDR